MNDTQKISLIVKRYKERMGDADPRDQIGLMMAVEACHEHACPLDLDAMLAVDAHVGSVLHDVAGIARHLDRRTGKLGGCFVPRFALHTVDERA